MKFFLFFVLSIAVILGIITFQNDTEISVKFINWNFSGHIAIVLAVSFAVGLLGGISLLVPPWWKKAKTARTYKKRIHELEEEKASGDADEAPKEDAESEESVKEAEEIKKF
ncbi:MAG TPA: LapA family protein [Nitrospirae bacterium]|nr:LapA family protein [Nitrospirota bacterium]